MCDVNYFLLLHHLVLDYTIKPSSPPVSVTPLLDDTSRYLTDHNHVTRLRSEFKSFVSYAPLLSMSLCCPVGTYSNKYLWKQTSQNTEEYINNQIKTQSHVSLEGLKTHIRCLNVFLVKKIKYGKNFPSDGMVMKRYQQKSDIFSMLGINKW